MSMFTRLFKRRASHPSALFNGHFLEVKAFYVAEFGTVPCVMFIGELDIGAVFSWLKERYRPQTQDIFQHSYYDHDLKESFFNNTIIVLKNNRVIELCGDYCQILHSNKQYGWARELVLELAQFRKATEQPKENRIIGFARQNGLN